MIQEHIPPSDPSFLLSLMAQKDHEIEALSCTNEALSDRVDELEHQNQLLKEQIRLALHRQYGTSSEKDGNSPQLDMFNDSEELAAETELDALEDNLVEVPAYSRNKAGRKPIPANLPRREIVHDVADADKSCSCCGEQLCRIGESVSEQLDIIPQKVEVLRHIRPKYACKSCEEGVVEGKMPAQPIPGSIASPGALAYVATAKYADGLPLYRLEHAFDRLGSSINRATMSHWMVRVGELVQPFVDYLRQSLLDEPAIHADETTTQVLDESGKPAESTSYMWVYRSAATSSTPVTLFEYQPSRQALHPQTFLTGFEGYLHCDGYKGYESLKNIALVGCWAHVRRKYKDAEKALPKKAKPGKITVALNYIRKLYRIEKLGESLTSEARYALRQQETRPILDDFHKWLTKTQKSSLPSSTLGKAIQYNLNQWPKLIRYIEDGRLAIDNNLCERDIRPFAVGRKNWLFSKSQAGARSSANLYSLAMTARANNLNVYEWMKALFTELPNTSPVDYEQLMPWKWKPLPA